MQSAIETVGLISCTWFCTIAVLGVAAGGLVLYVARRSW